MARLLTPATALLDVLEPRTEAPAPSDEEVNNALLAFVSQLETLVAKHVKPSLSDQYLASNVFLRSRTFKSDAERTAYCKCHLAIALRYFKELSENFYDSGAEKAILSRMLRWKDFIVDYIYDLNEIVPFLERKTQGFVFFQGGKNSDFHTWELYGLSRRLAVQAAWNEARPLLDHRAAQVASIFVLRQSLELRFERVIAVYPRDKNGQSPKLRHGFHQDFIESHQEFFRFRGFSMKELQPLYDWCSEIVHVAYQPFAWQVAWALDIGAKILSPQGSEPGKGWNIANAVEVVDLPAMQAAFETYFLENYDHGAWQITKTRPEALVADRGQITTTTSPNFLPAGRRVSRVERFKRFVRRQFRRLR
ncbi:hypothetical protein EN813_038375 [Mesorhizobium sp. M00.F.Ca.ET.170.01.1.1]|nr:hypothetical protein EN813_038375 [Mesorhizobium sp. M00.F.Ca.ET.170.01.1.1]